ncbi:DUF885 domain-containing protein [Chryseosolibacter indicus]|uniref:DUF885 family protein n=1 Tax=Chryseosolibacter indicus TaxID=2782351 RepID=A0ABS5VV77_9BACT|nr:DUF885 domain-containing protein [Chryseosolibacter indicus]MBT1704707.1 DUF885 family protein [Chryseosolibacter indicus]
MYRLSIVVLAILFLACSQKEEKKTVTNQSFNNLLDLYYEDYLKLNPLEATQINDFRYNDQLPIDISNTYRQSLQTFYKRYQDSLLNYDRASLPDAQQLSFDILARELSFRQELLEYPEHLMPVQQMWGMALTMPQIGSGQSFQPFKTAKHYDDFLKRIDAFAIWVDTAIVNMKQGLSEGYTFPKVLMERVLPQCKDMMVKDVTKSIFYQPITNMPDSISADDKARLKDAYTKAIKEKIVPSYTKLHDFLKNEYIPRTRTNAGINAIQNGNAYYQMMIRSYTTTNLDPDSIFRLGESEVARIKGEMEKVKEQVSFQGDLQAFFKYVNEDKKFMPYKTDQQVIDAFKGIESKIAPRLKELFNMTPKTRFEVRQTEAFREMSASAEYNPGSPDGSRPGIFYVPVINPEEYNISGMETLFLHEAIPGHHYQVSLQLENQELPRFRRTLLYSAYAEGWALYTESLGKELGLFTDPIQYFGHLGDEMHRAIRLVVDVGLHTKGWTREQAIAYMMDNEPIAEQSAVAEIERYMAVPGQALSYKIGQLTIVSLRKRAEKELGDKFKIGLFHDEVLKYGMLPLNILEARINKWIEEEK